MRIIRIAQENPIEHVTNPQLYDYFKRELGEIEWAQRGELGTWTRRPSPNASIYYLVIWGYRKSGSSIVGSRMPRYKANVILYTTDIKDDRYSSATVTLYINSQMNVNMSGAEEVAFWEFNDDEFIKSFGLSEFMATTLDIQNFDKVRLPHEIANANQEKENKEKPISVRLTKKRGVEKGKMVSAMAIEFFAIPSGDSGEDYSIRYSIMPIEKSGGEIHKTLKSGIQSKLEAQTMLQQLSDHAKKSGYVSSDSPDYIPRGSTPENWDFYANKAFGEDPAIENEQVKDVKEEMPKQKDVDIAELLGSNNKMKKNAEDFEGFFSGQVPDYAVSLLGTSSVEASQVKASFGRANEAIDLVNRFDSSLLSNITFIFNFAKGGAYGVYVSALDRAIKTKALRKQLEQKGYVIEETPNGLTAFPKEGEKTSEEIQKDIDTLYQDLESRGGTAIGLNMDKVLSAAKMDASESKSADPNVWQWMAVLHLGGTIVHECVHAKGSQGEGPSESMESQFNQWALPIVNEKYKKEMEAQGQGEQFAPLTIGTSVRHADKKTWYKKAQMSYYFPQTIFERPIGSDLKGRFPFNKQNQLPEFGMADWGIIAQQDQSVPIEKRLGRQFMSPIPQDLDQANDVIEEQLRKMTRDIEELDPHAQLTELLSEGYDEDRGYTTLEGLLDEKRPHQLIVPLSKKASNMMKTATLFGFMNNLTISDGNTIPGLGDRVMAWDDRDEDFSADEDWIRSQPRYNPSGYDIKGFYYRWIDPRLQPQYFDDMTRDYTNTHPAKRFAVKIGEDTTRILSILNEAKNKIENGEIPATRFIMTNDIVPIIDKVFVNGSVGLSVFHLSDIDRDESINSVWVYGNKTDESQIERVEKYLQGKGEDDAKEILESIFAADKQSKIIIGKIVKMVKKIAKKYHSNGIYISGEYPRLLATKSSMSELENLDFGGGWGDQILRIGSTLAKELGVSNIKSVDGNSISFKYNGVDITFDCFDESSEITGGLKDAGVEINPFNLDVYNKDFTINMMIYDLDDNKIKDQTGMASRDLECKTVRTFFEPSYVCANNPMVILRAIKLHLKHGFEIDDVLKIAMKHYSGYLFEKYSETKLFLARENVLREGRIEGEKALREFGLEKLLD